VCDVLEDGQLALGIPAGVKMQSGVFALTPEAAAEVIAGLVAGRLVDLMAQEVRDIDEAALQQGRVKSSFYGHMQVPQAGRYIQRVKEGSREVEALVLEDIAADFIETLSPGTLYVFGPGTTTRAITEALGLSATLLGIDLVCDGQLLARDANETVLLDLLGKYKERCLVITPTGGQGYLLGRGNQQLSPAVLRLFDTQQIQVVATKTKISALQGRPLLVDTNDLALDKTLSGYRAITTGYRDRIVYPIAAASDFSGGFGPDSWQDGQ
jgi:predicted polyphosphate/ATP-dependent NAD kinase